MQLVVGFVIVILMVLMAVLFPVYGVYQNLLAEGMTYVRRPLWDPPNLYVEPIESPTVAGEADGSAAGKTLAGGAVDLEVIVPPNRKASPIFMDPLHGGLWKRKNVLGTLTAYLVIAYVVFVVWKWGWRG
ncbi:MAG: hypothetical protein MK108_15620 [Mariniblastus sp.]|nr:hypothetical protein [Mariniblastus sp.]